MPGLCREFLFMLVPLVAWLGLGSWVERLHAHEGPPFPLLMDQPLGEVKVSLWADPDIGDARFFIVVETPQGNVPGKEPRVAIWTEPTSGRLPRTVYPAERQSLRNRMQFEAQPYFDIQDHWSIGVSLIDPDGSERELLTEVESTPPGLGAWDLAIYLFPFVLLGGMWGVAMLRRRRSLRSQPVSQTTAARSNNTVVGSPISNRRDLGKRELGQENTATGGTR